jgi:hypothetical protein
VTVRIRSDPIAFSRIWPELVTHPCRDDFAHLAYVHILQGRASLRLKNWWRILLPQYQGHFRYATVTLSQTRSDRLKHSAIALGQTRGIHVGIHSEETLISGGSIEQLTVDGRNELFRRHHGYAIATAAGLMRRRTTTLRIPGQVTG